MAYVCIYVCMYVCIGACVYVCICIYVCLCICMHIHLYAYTFIYARVWVYICTRVGAFCLFVLSNLYTTCACITEHVYHRCFLTLVCVCGGGLEVGFVSACSWLALVTGVGGYVLAGVEIGGLSCIFLYFCGCWGGGWVCACIRTYTHTNYLGT